MPGSYFKGLSDHLFGVFKEPTLAEWVPVSGYGGQLEVIFMEAFQKLDNYGIPYGAPNPTAWVKTNADREFRQGDTLRIRDGKEYKIREIMPDGHETTQLTLSVA